MSVIDKLAPFKSKRVKGNSQEWFDGEVLKSIALRDKLFNKFNRSKLNVDKEIYSKSRKKSHSLILQKQITLNKNLKKILLNQRIFGKHLNHLVYLIIEDNKCN